MAAIIKQPTWVSYTPTITAGSGTYTAASGTGRYYKAGRVCHVQIQVTITTNGTAAGQVIATLPFTGAAFDQVLYGRESALSGVALTANVNSGATTAVIVSYNNTYPGANGTVMRVGGTYETVS